MIHCISIVNTDGLVALCQHYDRSLLEEQMQWEALLASIVFIEDGGCLREAAFKADCVRIVG